MTQLISFSFYGDPARFPNKYLWGMRDNLADIPQIYPGWTPVIWLDERCRRYADEFRGAGAIIRMRPEPDGASGMFWRFLAADRYEFPAADAILFRDCDSVVNVREAAAVQEWMASGRRFHVMHDYMGHTHPINGGMWGCRGPIAGIRDAFVAWPHTGAWGDDLRFLERVIRPRMTEANTLRHAGRDAPPNFLPGRPFPPHAPWSGYVGCPVTRDENGRRL